METNIEVKPKGRAAAYKTISLGTLESFIYEGEKGSKISPAAVRYLASLAVKGKIVPKVVGNPVPKKDIEYEGEIIKTRKDIIAGNTELLKRLSKKAKDLGIIGGSGIISKESQKEIKNFLTGDYINSLGGDSDVLVVPYNTVELALEDHRSR